MSADFFRVVTKTTTDKKGKIKTVSIEADYCIDEVKDIMVRGREFYAVWDEENGVWSKNEVTVSSIVDKALWKKKKELEEEYSSGGEGKPEITVRTLKNYKSYGWREYRSYITSLPDNYVPLNKKIIFSDTPAARENYSTCRLDYTLNDGDISAYDELMNTLYDPPEREKIEWAIGSVYSGDSKWIQKFLVFYGEAGSGKSTVLNIIQDLFKGYYTTFEAKALVGSSNAFATEMFRSDPLVAIQHDGDLSKIEDNTKLNSIVSHEDMVVNEKYVKGYTSHMDAMLFMGTNKPVKITDAKSGVTRRLIDVKPSGRKLPFQKYNRLMKEIKFELGAIGKHCLDVYSKLGSDYYNTYIPKEMMYKTDPFFNFVEASYFELKNEPYITLNRAYDMYKQYCVDNGGNTPMLRYLFREELKNYFRDFQNIVRIDNKQLRSVYSGFRTDRFSELNEESFDDSESSESEDSWIVLNKQPSLVDEVYSDCQAQYASKGGKPTRKWENVETRLKEIDTSRTHYVKVPTDHIVIDFDLRDENGEKSLQKCLSEATKWPRTYVEVSRGGNGLHLHYIYAGDVSELSSVYAENIEIKVFTGGSSLRRKLTLCNDIPISTLTSGLPIKEKKMINFERVEDEKHLRNLINIGLNKKVKCDKTKEDDHSSTTENIQYILKVLNDAWESGITYDVMDLYQSILELAAHSTHNKKECIKMVSAMKFKSKDVIDGAEPYVADKKADREKVKFILDSVDAYIDIPFDNTISNRDWSKYVNEPIVFFDIEVFKNLLVVVWKPIGEGKSFVKMINPEPSEIEKLLRMKLVGFNNRKYDNHILYARYLGWTIEDLYNLSQRIINSKKDENNGLFANAYNVSYADIYDYSSVKQSLKKFELDIEGVVHDELDIPWDSEVPPERWDEVASYCEHDVAATESVFNDRKEDYIVRQILSELSGLTMNHTTRQHATKIMFGDDRYPQSQFVYTDLSTIFPGYKYEFGKSTYRDEVVGEGGYVYAEQGIYYNVALLDIASMHPTSIEQLNLFGDKYTSKFSEIKQARISIKHGDDEEAKKLLGGLLSPFVDRIGVDISRKTLASALKLVINSIYGYTAAKFDNPFRDPRNVDNIVAKRGALFMVNLKHEVQERGFTVAHIKTDSIKIPNATPEIIQFVMDYGKQYGYIFEHEATYDRMCLVNDAVYICKYADYENSGDDELIENSGWSATGAQFAVPYVFKTLFSNRPIEFNDMCELKSVVNASMYLDFNENLGKDEHNYKFVGRVGRFTPMQDGCGAAELMVKRKEKYDSVTGTKGYRWFESEKVKGTSYEGLINRQYYSRLVDNAKDAISKYGDFEMFIGEEDVELPF